MDIVERLREGKFVGGKLLMIEAADEIERLQLREETLSGIIDGMTARFIEAQGAVEEIERLRRLIDKHINEKAELKQGIIDILEYLSAVQIAEVNIKHIARKALGEIPDAALKEGE